ncbi:hypothetical protein A2U01_0107475, partial [Trifolium medium]|nr:hypothetical protein [Trifolium medium]
MRVAQHYPVRCATTRTKQDNPNTCCTLRQASSRVAQEPEKPPALTEQLCASR